jgi:replication factor C subunit 3/5
MSKLISNKSHLPWVEKYRPEDLTDIISHKEIINTLGNLISNNKIPHMIFYGPPGTGKTTTILACAKEIYGLNYRSMILELNGSDDRGINVVREQIKNFSATDSKIPTMFESNSNSVKRPNIKLVILDEADAMTYDAQFALRRVVESYTDSTRFCLICNYLTKIIPALQSRCQMFRFAPIGMEDHMTKIDMVINLEQIQIEDGAKEKIVELSEGDMRKSLNLLQSLYMIHSQKESDFASITLNSVYKSIGYPTDEEKEEIVNSLSGKDLLSTYQILNRLQSENSLSNQDIIREISSYYGKTYIQSYKEIKSAKILKSKNPNSVIRMGLKEQKKLIDLFDGMAKIEMNLLTNTNSNIQLLAISSVINNYNRSDA